MNPLVLITSFYILKHGFNQRRRNVKWQSPTGVKMAMAQNLIFSVHIAPLYKYKSVDPFIYLFLECIEI